MDYKILAFHYKGLSANETKVKVWFPRFWYMSLMKTSVSKTVWTQISPDEMFGLIWIPAAWHSDGIPERYIFRRCYCRRQKLVKLPSMHRINVKENFWCNHPLSFFHMLWLKTRILCVMLNIFSDIMNYASRSIIFWKFHLSLWEIKMLHHNLMC